MSKIMLINILQPEECRIAILENGVLEELYVERTSHESYVGSIYKGRIVNIEPSIQAAFVDFGVGRNGFLHVSDVEPTYYKHLDPPRHEGRRHDERGQGRRDDRPPPGRGRDDDRPRREDRPRRDERRDDNRDRHHQQQQRSHQPPPRRTFADDILDEINELDNLPPTVTEAGLPEPPPVEEESVVGEPVSEPQAEAVVESEPPPVVEPEPEAPAAEEKPRKRTTRRKKEDAPAAPKRRRKKTAETEAEAAPAAETSEEQPPPELMESAERRTDEGDDSPDPPRLGSGGGDDDDDLFVFRRSRPAPAPRPEPEQPPSYPAGPEERFAPGPEEPAVVAPPPPAPPPPPPPPPRLHQDREPRGRGSRRDEGRRGGRRRDSIEDQLEADLAAAEVGAVREVNPPREAPEPVEAWPVETAPVEELAPEEVGYQAEPDAEEPSWEPEVDDRADLDPDEDFGRSRRRDDRGGRGDRGERGGRGDRRDRGGRGDRGDRRGRPGGGGRMGGRDGNGRPKPLIQDIFKRGQEVIVQVIKEHLGTKGPTLSTYISIPGRYLVLMPGLNRVGVSRKIQDEDQRRRLKAIFEELEPPKGVGFIIRTAGEDKSAKELQRDLAYLSRLWEVVVRRIRRQKGPAEIYQESDMITRHIRDTFTADVDKILIDEPAAFEAAKEFLQIVMPRYAERLELYAGTEPLFHKYGIEQEIEKIQQKKVPLPNGGSIVIEQTEALVAIDVNSGNFRADRNDAEETAYQINLQAAKEIARQLRLRDLAGVIVNDFIDMRDEKHRRSVERAVREAMKRDRARIKVLRMSAFGIIEMTRQRIRTSLKRSVYHECNHCSGTGHVKTPESMSLDVIRLVQVAACRDYIRSVSVTVTEEVANYLHNRKRKELAALEQVGKMTVQITGKPGAAPETLLLSCYDQNNNEVKLNPLEERRPTRR